MGNEADERLSERARQQDGVFSKDDALAAGLNEWAINDRIERRRWDLCYDNVYRFPGAPVTWRSELRAAAMAAGPRAAISHRAAARMLDLPGARANLVELSCPRWRRSQKPGLVVHESTRIDASDMYLIDGIPVSRPERVVMELAAIYRSADYVERVLFAAQRKRLITHASMQHMFERLAGRGRPGVQVVREALERWTAQRRPTESEMETSLLQLLRRNGLPEPVLQFEVYDDAGHFVARADAAYPQWHVVIEYDSDRFHSDDWSIHRDNGRRTNVLGCGYVTVVATRADIRSGGQKLCRAIRNAARHEPASERTA